jgi:hypothetical protein
MKYIILIVLSAIAAYWYFFMRTPADTSTDAVKPPCGCGCSGKAPCAGGDITTPTTNTLTKDEILANIPPNLPMQTAPVGMVRYTGATSAEKLPDPMYADLM